MKLERLQDGSLQSYFWLGFLSNIGSNRWNGYGLSSVKNVDALYLLADYLDIPREKIKRQSSDNRYYLHLGHKEFFDSLFKEYGLKDYPPSKVYNFTLDQTTCFLAGFFTSIVGGFKQDKVHCSPTLCITKKGPENWDKFFCLFYKILPSSRIWHKSDKGIQQSYLYVKNIEDFYAWRTRLQELQIPLTKKWDYSETRRLTLVEQRRIQAQSMREQGHSAYYVAKKLNLSMTRIYQIWNKKSPTEAGD